MEIRADRMCAFARLELHRLVRRSQAHFPGPVAGAGVGLPEQASDSHTAARVAYSTMSREDNNKLLLVPIQYVT